MREEGRRGAGVIRVYHPKNKNTQPFDVLEFTCENGDIDKHGNLFSHVYHLDNSMIHLSFTYVIDK